LEHLRGVVERITYQNEENGYSVIKCRVKNYTDLVTVVGSMPEVHVGSVLYIGGSWRVDAKYGRQFDMETFEETLPATVYGIEKYLGSGLIKGIGPKYAKKIVEQFGQGTLDVIEGEPDRLNEIPGIGTKRVERIKKSWTEQKEIKNIMMFLQGHDVSTAHATKIYKAYGNDSIKIVQENPYKLADDIWGIGFKTADRIAEKMGFGHEKYARLRSGIIYTLNKLSEEGHCYATRDQLLKSGTELLGVEGNLLSMTLDEMIHAKDVITDEIPTKEGQEVADKAIYLPPFYFSEVGTVKRLKIICENPVSLNVQTEGLAEHIEQKTGMKYDTVQKQAIISAVKNKVLVLTGGPGTGKTTTTLGIITAFRESGANILLAAPTGRAAKRLSEATGMEAKTIHRLLEVKPPDGYQRNEENPLDGDVLIVDECSMIDIMLMYNLLKAVPDTMAVIFVGDVDQLPSVGAGNVLRDMIDSNCFPVVRLTRIFRQAQTSRIIMNAHRINAGKMPDISNGKTTDFFFWDVEKMAQQDGLTEFDSAEIADLASKTIVDLVKTKLSKYYKTPSREIQVLTPMQRGVIGAANLNLKLQEAINPGMVGLRRAGVQYRVNDKVMQIRNNYDKEVFNGDMGIITYIDLDDRSLKVNFDGREVEYDISELDELVLSYATTIHKAQGSEYPIVVMPVLMNHFVMLQRNLIYTGITRAKKILVIVGTKKALAYAVKNVTVEKRNTMLKERLQKALPQVNAHPVSQTEIPAHKIIQYPQQGRTRMVAEPKPDYGKPSREEWLKEDLFVRLSRSTFRSRFHLSGRDKEYVRQKGMDTIKSHAEDFISKRLAPAVIPNDGKQTPMRGHPVFIAQHATACCCRGCLQKWHNIPAGRELTQDEQDYVVGVLMEWIRRQMSVDFLTINSRSFRGGGR
jgi:exodeoxyribonuclease V alpha subunit